MSNYKEKTPKLRQLLARTGIFSKRKTIKPSSDQLPSDQPQYEQKYQSYQDKKISTRGLPKLPNQPSLSTKLSSSSSNTINNKSKKHEEEDPFNDDPIIKPKPKAKPSYCPPPSLDLPTIQRGSYSDMSKLLDSRFQQMSKDKFNLPYLKEDKDEAEPTTMDVIDNNKLDSWLTSKTIRNSILVETEDLDYTKFNSDNDSSFLPPMDFGTRIRISIPPTITSPLKFNFDHSNLFTTTSSLYDPNPLLTTTNHSSSYYPPPSLSTSSSSSDPIYHQTRMKLEDRTINPTPSSPSYRRPSLTTQSTIPDFILPSSIKFLIPEIDNEDDDDNEEEEEEEDSKIRSSEYQLPSPPPPTTKLPSPPTYQLPSPPPPTSQSPHSSSDPINLSSSDPVNLSYERTISDLAHNNSQLQAELTGNFIQSSSSSSSSLISDDDNNNNNAMEINKKGVDIEAMEVSNERVMVNEVEVEDEESPTLKGEHSLPISPYLTRLSNQSQHREDSNSLVSSSTHEGPDHQLHPNTDTTNNTALSSSSSTSELELELGYEEPVSGFNLTMMDHNEELSESDDQEEEIEGDMEEDDNSNINRNSTLTFSVPFEREEEDEEEERMIMRGMEEGGEVESEFEEREELGFNGLLSPSLSPSPTYSSSPSPSSTYSSSPNPSPTYSSSPSLNSSPSSLSNSSSDGSPLRPTSSPLLYPSTSHPSPPEDEIITLVGKVVTPTQTHSPSPGELSSDRQDDEIISTGCITPRRWENSVVSSPFDGETIASNEMSPIPPRRGSSHLRSGITSVGSTTPRQYETSPHFKSHDNRSQSGGVTPRREMVTSSSHLHPTGPRSGISSVECVTPRRIDSSPHFHRNGPLSGVSSVECLTPRRIDSLLTSPLHSSSSHPELRGNVTPTTPKYPHDLVTTDHNIDDPLTDFRYLQEGKDLTSRQMKTRHCPPPLKLSHSSFDLSTHRKLPRKSVTNPVQTSTRLREAKATLIDSQLLNNHHSSSSDGQKEVKVVLRTPGTPTRVGSDRVSSMTTGAGGSNSIVSSRKMSQIIETQVGMVASPVVHHQLDQPPPTIQPRRKDSHQSNSTHDGGAWDHSFSSVSSSGPTPLFSPPPIPNLPPTSRQINPNFSHRGSSYNPFRSPPPTDLTGADHARSPVMKGSSESQPTTTLPPSKGEDVMDHPTYNDIDGTTSNQEELFISLPPPPDHDPHHSLPQNFFNQLQNRSLKPTISNLDLRPQSHLSPTNPFHPNFHHHPSTSDHNDDGMEEGFDHPPPRRSSPSQSPTTTGVVGKKLMVVHPTLRTTVSVPSHLQHYQSRKLPPIPTPDHDDPIPTSTVVDTLHRHLPTQTMKVGKVSSKVVNGWGKGEEGNWQRSDN